MNGASASLDRGLIGQHHIERERLQGASSSSALAAGAQHDLDIGPGQQRLDEADLEVARKRGKRADPHRLPRSARSAQRTKQFIAGGEDRIGMVRA